MGQAPSYDVVVVGAGVAGALAARALRREGCSVLLVDKATFPRYKVCGCCLNPRAVALLEAEGLGHVLCEAGAVPLERFHLAAGGHRVVLPLAGGFAVSRSRLDMALAQEAEAAGVHFAAGVRARLGGLQDGMRTVLLEADQQTREVGARMVLAADGLGGSLLRQDGGAPVVAANARIGAGAVAAASPGCYAPGTIYMACGSAGYCGLVVLEDGRLDLAAALDAEAVRREGLPALLRAILEEARLPLPQDFAGLAWRGTPPLTRRARCLTGPRILAIGDAAGYIEPFTGEGMAWAMASARAVVPLALEVMRAPTFEDIQGCERHDMRMERRWRAAHARSVAKRQWLCRLLAWLLRRPRLVRGGVVLLAVWPALARPALRYLAAPPQTFRT